MSLFEMELQEITSKSIVFVSKITVEKLCNLCIEQGEILWYNYKVKNLF